MAICLKNRKSKNQGLKWKGYRNTRAYNNSVRCEIERNEENKMKIDQKVNIKRLGTEKQNDAKMKTKTMSFRKMVMI